MQHVLVKFTADYSDEFDVHGIWVTTQDVLDSYLDKANVYFRPGCKPKVVYFGTNEAIEYRNYQDVSDALTVEQITPEESERLKELIGGISWGYVAIPEF